MLSEHRAHHFWLWIYQALPLLMQALRLLKCVTICRPWSWVPVTIFLMLVSSPWQANPFAPVLSFPISRPKFSSSLNLQNCLLRRSILLFSWIWCTHFSSLQMDNILCKSKSLWILGVFSQGLGIWHHSVSEAATWLQLMACAILHILSTSRTLIWSAVPASMVASSTLKVWFSPLYNPSYCQQPCQQNSCYICRNPYKIQVLTQLRKKDWSSYAKTDLRLLSPQKGCSMNVDYVVRRDCEMGLRSKVIIFFASNTWVYVKQGWQVWRSWMLGGAILSKIQMSSIFLVCFFQYVQPS